MRTATILPAILLAVTCVSARAQDVATLKIEGRGVEGRPAYRGGRVVKFHNISLGARVIHYQPGEAPPWPLEITYDVLEQRQAIGDIFERTAKGVRQARPCAKMSVAVFANLSDGASQGQDPAARAQAGWTDFILPMDYHGLLATKLYWAAGDRFHWTKPAYEVLAQCAAVQIEQVLAVAAGKNGKKP